MGIYYILNSWGIINNPIGDKQQLSDNYQTLKSKVKRLLIE